MKTYQFLTTKKFFEGQLIRLFSREKFAPRAFPKIAGYTLVKPLKEQTDIDHNSIGIYQDRKQNTVVIKHLFSQKNAMAKYQLLNEKSMLDLLNTLSQEKVLAGYKISFPRLLSFRQTAREMYLAMELVDGQLLRDKTAVEKVQVVSKCLEFLEALSAEIPVDLQKQLPLRSALLQHLTLPIYVVIALLAKPKNAALYTQMFFIYYRYTLKNLFVKTPYTLAHKDLHQDNIMLNRSRITIIDPQVSVLSERFTDLAIVARLYLPEIGVSKLKKLLGEFLQTEHDKAAFVRLSIYFSFQLMAIKGVEHKFYAGAIEYLSTLNKKLLPNL